MVCLHFQILFHLLQRGNAELGLAIHVAKGTFVVRTADGDFQHGGLGFGGRTIGLSGQMHNNPSYFFLYLLSIPTV